MDEQSIKDQVRGVILTAFLPGESPENLGDDVPLRSSGILDSVSTLKLVTMIEDKYNIAVEPHEASSEFDRIVDIAAMVKRKL